MSDRLDTVQANLEHAEMNLRHVKEIHADVDEVQAEIDACRRWQWRRRQRLLAEGRRWFAGSRRLLAENARISAENQELLGMTEELGDIPMTEDRYQLVRRTPDQGVVIIDAEGQELICLPRYIRAEFSEDILPRAINTAYVCGAEAERERIQNDVLKATKEFHQSLWGIEPGWGPVPVEQDAPTLAEHLMSHHHYALEELAGLTFPELLSLHNEPDQHPHLGTPTNGPIIRSWPPVLS